MIRLFRMPRSNNSLSDSEGLAWRVISSIVSKDERESWNDVPLTVRFPLCGVERCLSLRMRFPDVGPMNETARVCQVWKTNVP